MIKKMTVFLLCMLLLAGCAAGPAEPGQNNPVKAPLELNEEVELRAAEEVVRAYRTAGTETFDLSVYDRTLLTGNGYFLKYVKADYDANAASANVSAANENVRMRLTQAETEWTEFRSAGGTAEFGVACYELIVQGHDDYRSYMNRFESDEDTGYLDSAIVEAFAVVTVGVDWVVPKKMESDWGKTRHEKIEVTVVRIDGNWYVVGL